MTAKPGRLFEVAQSEFPIQVTISIKDLTVNQSFVADTIHVVGGVPAGTVPVTLRVNGDTKSYTIAAPGNRKATVLSTINAFFPDTAPATARYIVDIVATGGDKAQTRMSPPVINPSAAFLSFQIVPRTS